MQYGESGIPSISKKLYEKRPSRFEKYLRSGKEAKVLHIFTLNSPRRFGVSPVVHSFHNLYGRSIKHRKNTRKELQNGRRSASLGNQQRRHLDAIATQPTKRIRWTC